MIGNAAKTGFFLIALGFPLYLVWRGRGGLYLRLATTGSGMLPGGAVSTAQTQIDLNNAGMPPTTPGGTAVPYIGVTPNVPGLIPGMKPGA